MINTLDIKQNLVYYYNFKEQKLYVKSNVFIQIDRKDRCYKKTKTPMDKEAHIGFLFKRVAYDASPVYHDAVLMLLKSNVVVSSTNPEMDLKKIIIDDMNNKGITHYTVHAGAQNTSTSESDGDTATISNNATIELDKANETMIVEIEQNA